MSIVFWLIFIAVVVLVALIVPRKQRGGFGVWIALALSLIALESLP